MKFTKHAHTKVWQNYPENEHEDTTITPYDYEDTNKPNSIPVALLHLLECHAFANSMNEFNEIYKNNPDPLSCHNCGQRFKHASQNQPAYKHQNNRADILHTLKLKAETQPTFDLTESNQ